MPDTTHPHMQAEIKSLRADIRDLGGNLSDFVDSARGVVQAGKGEAIDRISDTADKAWTEAKSLTESLSKQIDEYPVMALVSAFSIVMLLGLCFLRRRKRA